MATVTFSKDHDRYMRSFAFKVFNRARAAGAASVALEDIYQELCIAWCKARDSWSADYNVPFLAYLSRGMQHHINRWVQEQIGEGRHVSIDGSAREVEGESVGLHSAIPDQSESAFDAFARIDVREFAMQRLSDRAGLFVSLLADPPKFLVDAVADNRARASYGRDLLQVTTMTPTRVTAAMIFDFMMADHVERRAIYADIQRVSKLIAKRHN